MQTSTIKFSQIEDRIDAEYYKPEYLKIYNNLEKRKGVVLLEDVAKEVVSGSYIDTYFPKRTLYLRVNNLKEDGFDLSDVKYVDIQYSKVPQKIRVHTNDLVLGRTGTVGTTLIVPNELDGAVMSQHITKIVPSEKINRFYLMIYLNSRHGRLQAEKTALGSMQKELTLDATKNIKVFIPPQSLQQKIEKIVKEAQEKRKLADEKYDEAEEILNKELGLGNLDLSTQKTFEAKFSEAEDRFDPEYYQSKYKKIISKLKTQNSKPLGEIVKIRKGIEVGHESYTTEGVPFIRVQDYNEKEISISGSTNFIRPYLYAELKKNHKPDTGEIIYSKDGTVGRAFVVPEDSREFIVSGGILILTPRDIDNYYLALVLNSEIVRSQAVRKSIGAIIQHLSIDEVKKLQIPILPQSTQQKISSLIQKSFKFRKESKELINKAKREVEEMIEKN